MSGQGQGDGQTDGHGARDRDDQTHAGCGWLASGHPAMDIRPATEAACGYPAHDEGSHQGHPADQSRGVLERAEVAGTIPDDDGDQRAAEENPAGPDESGDGDATQVTGMARSSVIAMGRPRQRSNPQPAARAMGLTRRQIDTTESAVHARIPTALDAVDIGR